MTLTNLLEKIKRDHQNPATIKSNGHMNHVMLKTHHEELLRALEITLKQRDRFVFEACKNYPNEKDQARAEIGFLNREIEDELKGCGDAT